MFDGQARRPRAVVFGFTIAAATLASVGVLALVSEGDVTLPILWVERLGSLASGFVLRAGQGVGLGAAFVAGTIAAFNPCGFALVPAYLGLYLGEEGAGSSRISRALWVSMVVSLAFLAVFGIVGAAIGAAASLTVRFLPWLGLLAGAMLVVGGAAVVAGWHPMTASGGRLADRLGAAAGRGGIRGYAAFGVAYGLASLSCTLPVVFAVVGVGAGSTEGATAALRLASFAAGVAFVLAAITVVAGTIGTHAVRSWRRLGSIVPTVGGLMLLLAGAYTVFYWLTIGRTLLF